MSKEDIDKAVREAEKFAEEDKKQKEAVEVKNQADHMIFTIEKSMSDLGDKITDADKAPVNEAIATLKKTMESGDTEAIKKDTDALMKSFEPIAQKIYSEQQAGAQPGAEGAGDGNVYGADFEDKT